MSVRSRPAKASIAAPPVSPEVAPAIVARDPRSASTWSISRASSCMATSLKASVGPWNSSRMKRFGADLDQRADRLVAKRRVGLAHHPLEAGRLDLAIDERRKHADRQVGIGKPAHGADLGGGELRPLPRDVEAAVAGKPGQQRVGKAENGRLAPGTHILHRHLSVAALPAVRLKNRPFASRIFAARLL